MASYKNTIGAASLKVSWQDPSFRSDERAFYYVRVLESKDRLTRGGGVHGHDPARIDERALIVLGGEPIYNTDVDLYKRYFASDCVFINRYGSMETESVCMYFVDKQSQIKGARVPIGHPLEDVEVLVLDDQGERVGRGDVGEIEIGSRYLSLGYWRLPELTQEKFLSDREDPQARVYLTGDLGWIDDAGRTAVLGRKDTKVNIRGYLVETSELEGRCFASIRYKRRRSR
mgnify:CR=1 FL=1